MVNVKKGYLYCDIHKISYLNFCKKCNEAYCDLCKIDTDKRHYFSKEHIDNFEKKYNR